MKQVILKSLTLVNFKGHKDLTINFGEETVISGDNATGKSTVADAFFWLLYGKDQQDRKDYEITPIINNKKLEKVDTEVSAVLLVDGRETTFKRIFRQNWVRPRGQSEEVFKGNETLFYWNDVPKKAGEYKDLVDATLDEAVFKLITNPATFLGLHWTKQREILFNIAGTVTDAEILDKMATLQNKDAVLNLTNMLNQGKNLVEYKKEIAARKKKLKADLDDIQPRIDQTTRLMPEQKDWAAIEANLITIQNQLNDIDTQLADRSKAIRGQYDEIQTKQGQINDLKTKQQALINRLKTEAQNEANTSNQARIGKQGELQSAQMELTNAKQASDMISKHIDILDKSIEAKNKAMDALRDRWETVNAKEYKEAEGCLMCPVFNTQCSDPQATAKHQEAQEKAREAFFQSKDKELEDINKEGIALKEEVAAITSDRETLVSEQITAANKANEVQAKVTNLTNELTNTPAVGPRTIEPEKEPEWLQLQEQIKAIEATIQEVKPLDNSNLSTKKAELNQQRDQLKKDLDSRDQIIRCQDEIKNLGEKGKELAQQIADLEKQEFAISDFTKYKIDECERRINSMFEIVRFQLFDKTIEGNEFEACIALNRAGVPISATNTAEKVNSGMDIIRTLTKFYNVEAPIFADGSESVNRYIKAGSQMVFLRVTKEPVLTIN